MTPNLTPVGMADALMGSKRQSDAATNRAEFIRMCREELTWLRDDPSFEWDAPVWPGARWRKVGARPGRTGDWLDEEFADFAKAYYRWQHSHSPTASNLGTISLRCLEAALLQVTGSGCPDGLSLAVLDEAAVVARAHYSESVGYHVGRGIAAFARFVTERHLVPVDLSSWRSSLPRPDSARRTGARGRADSAKKMPSQAALDAMAEIFANDPSDPVSRLVSAVWALLMSAPWRISELLRLHVGAEHEGMDDRGELSYGFRTYGAKGFGHDIKWISRTMEPVAREAFRRIRDLTQSARDLARHVETTPDVPLRYPDCPPVDMDEALSLDAKAAYLRRRTPERESHAGAAWEFTSVREHWEKAKRGLPRGFPVFDPVTGLKWADALFCTHRHFLAEGRGTDWYSLAAVTQGMLGHLLAPSSSIRTIFERWGYAEPDGRRMRLTTHQARHYLSTLAERGGMSQHDLAKWAGRASAKDNRVYNHMTDEDYLENARTLVPAIGLASVSEPRGLRPPVTSRDFELRKAGAVHRTEYGYCVRDWVASPCDRYRDCLNCHEHACVKGDAERHARIAARMREVEAELAAARKATEEGAAGADNWVEHLSRTLGRGRELLALLESEEVADGAVVMLREANEQSHLGRALEHRLLRPPDSRLPPDNRGLPSASERSER